MINQQKLALILAASSLVNHGEIASDGLKLSEADQGHVQSQIGASLVDLVGVTGRDIVQERYVGALALKM
jgi:hypothetical protein